MRPPPNYRYSNRRWQGGTWGSRVRRRRRWRTVNLEACLLASPRLVDRPYLRPSLANGASAHPLANSLSTPPRQSSRCETKPCTAGSQILTLFDSKFPLGNRQLHNLKTHKAETCKHCASMRSSGNTPLELLPPICARGAHMGLK